MKVRIRFSKYGALKFIGHLDVMRYFQKAIRRSGIPIAYSEGFSPHQIMSFAAPLSVGHTSEGEYMDIELADLPKEESYPPKEGAYSPQAGLSESGLRDALQAVMVDGISILDVQFLPAGEKNAMASVAAASYLISFREGTILPSDWQEKLTAFYGQEQIPVIKKTKKGEKQMDLKENIYELELKENGTIYMLLNASSGGNIKPSFVLETFFESIGYELPAFSLMIHRLETYKNAGNQTLTCSANQLIDQTPARSASQLIGEEERRLVPLIWER